MKPSPSSPGAPASRPASSPPSPPPLFASVTSRELTAGSLALTAVSVWWRHLFKFAGLSLLALLPTMAAGIAAIVAISAAGDHASASWSPFLTTALGVVMIFSWTVLQLGGLTLGAVQHLTGHPVRFGAMVATTLRRAPAVLGAAFLTYAMVLLGTALLVVPGAIVACALSVSLPAAVMERVGPLRALKRSWELTRGSRDTLFLAGLVLGVPVFVVSLAAQAGTTLFGPLAPLALLAIQALVTPLPMLLAAVAYHGLRVAREGSATEDLAKIFE